MSFIRSIEINPASFPISKPFSNHVRQITHLNGLIIRIFTDDVIVGQSVMYGLGVLSYDDILEYIKTNLLSKLIDQDEIKDGQTLHDYWDSIWQSLKQQCKTYEELYALASFDIAIWDIFTKSKNISLHQYLGGAQTKISAYGTTGWLSYSEEELIAECHSYIKQGVKAFKIRIGHKDDCQRIKAIRDAMGNDFIIMLDANQRYSHTDAARISDELSKFNILWLEEPTDNSLESIKKINHSCKIPIALGENIIEEELFENICKNRLTKYLQPDIPRCGGITGFIKVMRLADQYKIPICNHLMYELSVSLIASTTNGYMIEYDNFISPEILTSNFSAKDGFISVPDAYGTGVEITDLALKKIKTNSYIFEPTFKNEFLIRKSY